jgi:hypothetical protein
MGIEPTYSAWEADVLPLNYTRQTGFCRCTCDLYGRRYKRLDQATSNLSA